jgi:hypothetical protein
VTQHAEPRRHAVNRRTKTAVVWLAVLVLSAPLAFGGSGRETPSGDPPFGTAVQSDAQGTKLTGIGILEFYNIELITVPPPPQRLADVRVLVRLRQGSQLDTVFTELVDVDMLQVAATQARIIDALRSQILDKFFNNDQTLGVTVKGITDFVPVETVNSFANQTTQMDLFNVVLAVK